MRAGIRSLMLAALAAAATFTLFIRNAEALGGGECFVYTEKAKEQVKQATEMKCGFEKGFGRGKWSPNPAAHRSWCLSVKESETAKADTETRRYLLEKCGRCRSYANAAATSGRENMRLSCGFKGGEWNTDFQYHYSWCMGTHIENSPTVPVFGYTQYFIPNDHYIDEEQAKRDQAVKQCRAQLTDEQIATCFAYSKRAEEQALWHLTHSCDREGPRWSTDPDLHFGWCTAGFRRGGGDGTPITELIKQEEEARQAENNKCEVRQSGIAPAQSQATTKRRSKTVVKPPEIAVQRPPKPAAQSSSNAAQRTKTAVQPSSSAMDRLGGSSAAPASGGSYKSKDGAPTQTRSSGGGAAGSDSSGSGSWSGNTLRTSPGTGSMSTGGGEKFRAPN